MHYQSDIVVGGTLCERMLHQSRCSTFEISSFYQQSVRKTTDTENQNMLNICPDNQCPPTIDGSELDI